MFIPDANTKTVKIPVQFVDGNLINLLTERPLSGISNNTFCDIILDSVKITDDNLLEVLDTEEIDEFLPEGTELLATVNPNNIPDELSEHAKRPDNLIFGSPGLFVSIVLKQPLRIKFHGIKQPNLLDCECYIPSLLISAESLNHAYTLISTEFEPHRRSHSGNVFQKIFYKSQQENYTNNHWIELEHLRYEQVNTFYNYLSNKVQPPTEPIEPFRFNESTYELLRPLLKTILREFNQDIIDAEKASRTLIFVLNEKYKYSKESILSLKPYIVRLLENLSENKDSII